MAMKEHSVPAPGEHHKFSVTGETSSVGQRQEKDDDKGCICQAKEFELELARKERQCRFFSLGAT